MSYIIALAGKGGTGKTTIASLLVRILKEKGKGSILAVDADPNSNLAEFLGINNGKSIGSIVDDIAANPDMVPKGMAKDMFIELEVQKALAEDQGFDVLTMGRPEGPGCYCYVNNVLRNLVTKIAGEYDYVVIDNEAGLEHLSRRTMRSADSLIVVSDATQAGLRAAKRILELAYELKIKIKKKFLIINRASSNFDSRNLKDFGEIDYLGQIPEDEEILELSRKGAALLKLNQDTPTFKKLMEMTEKLWL